MLWTKVFHLLFIISWFAGLFYLPRLYVNIAQQPVDSPRYQLLVEMSHRLYRFMQPLAFLGVTTGLGLYLYYGIGSGRGWIHAKMLLVLGLIAFHGYCGRILTHFKRHSNQRSHVFYRWFNEIPVLVLLLVLILVVLKPF